jgi:hypothetical protein
LELGRVGFKERDVADLLTLYGVTDQEEREGLLALARESNAPGWWHQYSDVMPSWFEVYVALEDAASMIRGYEMQYVPGLLQTSDYAQAVTTLRHAEAAERETERFLSLRMRRQRLFTRPDAPKLCFVIDEAVLRRSPGGRQVMRAQLEHLIEVTTLPNVTLQVIPFHTQHRVGAGSFTILEFADPALADVVYLEQLVSAVYLDRRADVDVHTELMNHLCAVAESPEATRRILSELAAGLDG